jgi:hypothetical protein
MNFLPSITSLLITRKLYIISTLRDVEAPSRRRVRLFNCGSALRLTVISVQRLIDLSVEWGWGLGYPLLMTVVVCTVEFTFLRRSVVTSAQIPYARTLVLSSSRDLVVLPAPPILGSVSWLSRYFHSFLHLSRSSSTAVRILPTSSRF